MMKGLKINHLKDKDSRRTYAGKNKLISLRQYDNLPVKVICKTLDISKKDPLRQIRNYKY